MRVVIHGGMFKTGTTSLQQSLNAKRFELSKEGIFYPYSEIGQHSYILNVRNPLWSGDALREIAFEAERKGAELILFSGESVSALSQSQFDRLTACFEGWPVEYVFCFRHWSTYLPSRWAQNCIRRDSQTFEEYLENALNSALSHFDARFDLILTRAASSGASNVHAVSWDLAKSGNESVPVAVLRAASIEERIIRQITNQSQWLNQRLDFLNVEMCRILNGVSTNMLGLVQNELFWVYADHQECSGFFDYFKLLHKISPEDRDIFVSTMEATGISEITLPKFDELEGLLFDNHAHRFTNVIGQQLFGNAGTADLVYKTYPVKWQSCIPICEKILQYLKI